MVERKLHALGLRSLGSEKRKSMAKRSAVSIGQLRDFHPLHTQPIDLVVFQEPSLTKETLSWGKFHAYMLSAFILSERSYPAVRLAP